MIVRQRPVADAKEEQSLSHMCALPGEIARSTEMVRKTATPTPPLIARLSLHLLQVLQQSVLTVWGDRGEGWMGLKAVLRATSAMCGLYQSTKYLAAAMTDSRTNTMEMYSHYG